MSLLTFFLGNETEPGLKVSIGGKIWISSFLTADSMYLLHYAFSLVLPQDHTCYHRAGEIINFWNASDSLSSEVASKLSFDYKSLKAAYFDCLPQILGKNHFDTI